MFVTQFRFRYRFHAWFCLAVVAFSVAFCTHPANGQTPTATTSVPSELNRCLPQTSEHLSAYEFGLIATADTPEAKLYYLNVFSIYDGATSFWRTLIKASPDLSSCQNLIPEETQPVSLTQFMPLEQATQLAKRGYEEWRTRNPDEFKIFLRRLQNKSIVRTSGDPMDNAPLLGQTEPIRSTTCQLFPEEAEALNEMGIRHKCQINPS